MKSPLFRNILLGLMVLGSTLAQAQETVSPVTPMDAVVKEGEQTLITCELKEDSKMGEHSQYAATHGIYSYKVFLPTGYASQPERQYPALFVSHPRGNAPMQITPAHANTEGWIVVSLVEFQYGTSGPDFGNMLAAHDDAIKRFRIKEGLKFALGPNQNSVFSLARPGFAGVLLQDSTIARGRDGKFEVGGIKPGKPFSVFMVVGEQNTPIVQEIDVVKSQLPKGSHFKAIVYPGPTAAFTQTRVDEGLDWLLLQTLAEGDFSAETGPLFDGLATRLVAWPVSAEKLEAVKGLIAAGKKAGVNRDPALAAKLKSLEGMETALELNPDIAKQAQSHAALASAEEKAREELKDLDQENNNKKRARSFKKAAEIYEKMAKEFEGTAAGDEAKKKAAELMERVEAIKN